MKTIHLEPKPYHDGDLLEVGKLLTDSDYDTVLDESVRVFDPHGRMLCTLLKDVLSCGSTNRAYRHLRKIRGALTNRATAARGRSSRAALKDGSISKTVRMNVRDMPSDVKMANSGIIGNFDRSGARFPYCRQTAWNREHVEQWTDCQEFIREVSYQFKQHAPDRYAAQLAVCEKTDPAWVIPGTVFTTLTVNRNWQTRTHYDKGDLAEGCGVMSAYSGGDYTGCYLCFPRYRVALNMRSYDVVLANVHELHGNTPVHARAAWERVSTVFYYRNKMQQCGSPEEEQKRATGFKKGGSVRDFYA